MIAAINFRLYFNWMNPGLTRELHMATIMHHGSVETATFLSPSRRIMTANGDGQIKLWDVESGAVQVWPVMQFFSQYSWRVLINATYYSDKTVSFFKKVRN